MFKEIQQNVTPFSPHAIVQHIWIAPLYRVNALLPLRKENVDASAEEYSDVFVRLSSTKISVGSTKIVVGNMDQNLLPLLVPVCRDLRILELESAAFE